MTGRQRSGPLGVSEAATNGDLGELLVFPKDGSALLNQAEDELWDRLAELTRREHEAEALAAQGRPFIG